jgi:hypothetical protein
MFHSIANRHELFLRVNPEKPLCYDHLDFGIVPFLPLRLPWPGLKLTIHPLPSGLAMIQALRGAVHHFFAGGNGMDADSGSGLAQDRVALPIHVVALEVIERVV